VSTTIRVSDASRARLAALAAEAGQPMTVTLDEALDALERKRFFAEVNARYKELRDDPETWRVIRAERAEWDATLTDGLD
jgi:predicted transcriptional regulator